MMNRMHVTVCLRNTHATLSDAALRHGEAIDEDCQIVAGSSTPTSSARRTQFGVVFRTRYIPGAYCGIQILKDYNGEGKEEKKG